MYTTRNIYSVLVHWDSWSPCGIMCGHRREEQARHSPWIKKINIEKKEHNQILVPKIKMSTVLNILERLVKVALSGL
jgi:hypothetical protein